MGRGGGGEEDMKETEVRTRDAPNTLHTAHTLPPSTTHNSCPQPPPHLSPPPSLPLSLSSHLTAVQRHHVLAQRAVEQLVGAVEQREGEVEARQHRRRQPQVLLAGLRGFQMGVGMSVCN